MTRLQELEHMLKSHPSMKLVDLGRGRWAMADGVNEPRPVLWWGTRTIQRAVNAGLVEGPESGPLTQRKKEGK